MNLNDGTLEGFALAGRPVKEVEFLRTQGDPYYVVASDPGSPVEPNVLYDPNYRNFDVEGYRIYRGRVDAPNIVGCFRRKRLSR